MRTWIAFSVLLLSAAWMSACGADEGQTVVRSVPQSFEHVGTSIASDETPYCVNAGQCRPLNGHCCTYVQTTHTTCTRGKCCRGYGQGCTRGANQCCYPNNCVLLEMAPGPMCYH
jgi:hypothetical protein